MTRNTETSPIVTLFRETVLRDRNLINAYLLVHSNRTGLHLNLAEGPGENGRPNPQQPVYMASVGKLFTSVVVSLLHEQKALSFDDPISRYLDAGLTDGLHVYRNRDYSQEIRVRHLLNQTSGLPDNFYPLFDKLLADPGFMMSPREAVEWAKQNLKPQAAPGRKSYYTDTNYHLLGLIVEQVCGEPFHAVMKRLVFDPVGMQNSYMLHSSKPEKAPEHAEAGFYFKQTRLNAIPGFAGLDYSGGGVVAPMDDLLLFMKALTGHRLVSEKTLGTMLGDKATLYPSWDYGYGIWQVRPIPLLLPAKYRSWGVLGATGAFMFYHPGLEAYIIGSFNHQSWQRKCVRFMFRVMDEVQ
jgi:D-alanyl-D-alanine carboxypeptidase